MSRKTYNSNNSDNIELLLSIGGGGLLFVIVGGLLANAISK